MMDDINTLVNVFQRVGEKLGRGYTENIYHEGICMYLRNLNIKYAKEVVLQVELEGFPIGNVRADIVLPELQIVVECKAVENELREAHLPQIITYMNILNYSKGMFVNYIQHPSKLAVQVYYVVREDGLFKFYDYNSKTITTLDAVGNLVQDVVNTQDWVSNNICKDEVGMLSKADCKNSFPCKTQSDSKQLIQCIETFCNQKFKDKQVDGIKYTGVINGWKLVG
jgi:GxxExxY protein